MVQWEHNSGVGLDGGRGDGEKQKGLGVERKNEITDQSEGSIEAKAAVKDDFWGEWEENSWVGGRVGRS